MPDRAQRSATTAERLGRLLVIVPYLIQHPGTTLDVAAKLFDVPSPQLRRDLELLFLSGVPPYGPGDLIEVDVDEDGAVWIGMAEHFSRPLRLTRAEALALQLRATELLGTPGVPEAPALASALRKIQDSLGATPGIEEVDTHPAPPRLGPLRDAAEGRRRIKIDYVAASTGERAWRTIEPEAVFASLGNWYVVAWDLDSDGERLFRVDRVARLEETGSTFQARGLQGAGRPLYSPSASDVAVTLILRPAARWVGEYYATTSSAERADGGLEVTLPARGTAWAARLVLRLWPDAEIVDPAALRDEVRTLARETLAVYGR